MAEVKDFPFEVTASTYSPVKTGGTPSANKNKDAGLISSIIAFGSKRFSNLGGKQQPRDGGSLSPGTPPRNGSNSPVADVELGRKSTSPHRYNFPRSSNISPNQKSSRRSSLRRSVAAPANVRSVREEIDDDDNNDYEPSNDGESRGSRSESSNSDGSSAETGTSGDGEGPLEDDEQYINDDEEDDDDEEYSGDEEQEENPNNRGLLHIEQTLKEFGVMSKELFKKKIKLMNQRKKWAQRYSRYLAIKVISHSYVNLYSNEQVK
jgi:hypothetical protein